MTGVTVTPCRTIEIRTMNPHRAPQEVRASSNRLCLKREGEVIDGAEPADAEEADHGLLGRRAGGAGEAEPAAQSGRTRKTASERERDRLRGQRAEQAAAGDGAAEETSRTIMSRRSSSSAKSWSFW